MGVCARPYEARTSNEHYRSDKRGLQPNRMEDITSNRVRNEGSGINLTGLSGDDSYPDPRFTDTRPHGTDLSIHRECRIAVTAWL